VAVLDPPLYDVDEFTDLQRLYQDCLRDKRKQLQCQRVFTLLQKWDKNQFMGRGEPSEFAERDSQGLEREDRYQPKDPKELVSSARAKYVQLMLVVLPAIQQILAWSTYYIFANFLGYGKHLDARFEFLRQHDLGHIYLAVFITMQARVLLQLNANAMRAGARVGRPDQYAYMTMDSSAREDAPLVMMKNTGHAGRFNRAQRAISNTDETLPTYLICTVLAGVVFGPVVVILSMLHAYGRVQFGRSYTASKDQRGFAFRIAVVTEAWMSGLLALIATKTLADSWAPL
jgi:hypothetical protein